MYSALSGSSSSSSSAALAAENAGRCVLPTEETNATTSTPWAILRYFSAMAPAATRPGEWVIVQSVTSRRARGKEGTTRREGTHRWSRERSSVLLRTRL